MSLKLINKKNAMTASAICFAAMMMSSTAIAKPGGPGGGKGGHPGGPPPEAIEACNDKSENDACSFTTPRGDEIEGTCIVPPRDEASLICAPEGGPPPHEPPPEKPE